MHLVAYAVVVVGNVFYLTFKNVFIHVIFYIF